MNQSLKLFIYAIIFLLASKNRYKPKRLILCYHRLCKYEEVSEFSITTSSKLPVEMFESHIRWLSSFCDFVSLEEITDFVDIKARRWKVSVTFDDGYSNVLKLGYPIFRRYKIPVTIFVNSFYVQNKFAHPWWDILDDIAKSFNGRIKINIFNKNLTYDFLSTNDIKRFLKETSLFLKLSSPYQREQLIDQLRKQTKANIFERQNEILTKVEIARNSKDPLITFGGHSYSHTNLAACSNTEQYQEIFKDKELLTQWTGGIVNWFSYPYGKIKYRNSTTVEYVKTAGFQGALTLEENYLNKYTNTYEVPRLGVNVQWPPIIFKAKVLGLQVKNIMEKFLTQFRLL